MQDYIIDGLSCLEYREYDSAGVGIMRATKTSASQAMGKLSNLKTELARKPLVGRLGIGHTRWATHGALLNNFDSDDAAAGDFALPEAPNAIRPFLHAAAVQMYPYYASSAKGTDVDQPKNLAKSVTIE